MTSRAARSGSRALSASGDSRTLLQRLLDDPPRSAMDVDTLRASVLDNLRQLFRTRQGDAPCDPLYGLPDFTVLVRRLDQPFFDDAGKPIPTSVNQQGVTAIRRAVEDAIKRYEPRLTVRRLGGGVDEERPCFLYFELDAVVELDERAVPFVAQVRLDTDGRCEVR